MEDSLDRFVVAQERVYAEVLNELRRGQKTGHWMWFIFPQLAGLGRSETARFYAISSAAEARAYLAHPILGARLRECTALVTEISGRSLEEVFGAVDAMKFHSCMTLFGRTAPEESVFRTALTRFYGGREDDATIELLHGRGG